MEGTVATYNLGQDFPNLEHLNLIRAIKAVKEVATLGETPGEKLLEVRWAI